MLTVFSWHTQQQYSLDHIPTLFIATKSDLDLAQQVRFFLFTLELASAPPLALLAELKTDASL